MEDALIEPVVLGLLLIWAVGFGVAASRLARTRDRSVTTWAVYGAVTGPAALALLWFAPPGRCGVCHSPVRGWSSECQYCASDVRVDPVARRYATTTTAATGTLRPQPGAKASAPATVEASADAAQASGAAGPAAPVPAAPRRRSARASAKSEATAGQPATPAGIATNGHNGADATTHELAAGPVATIRAASGAPSASELAAFDTPTVHVSGVYVTGSVGLRAGARYTIEADRTRLRVLGPVDGDPTVVAIERRLSGIDATGYNDRLIISEPDGGRSPVVLVFMAIGGGTPDAVAERIVQAAAAADVPG
jgi:hypothetical protein